MIAAHDVNMIMYSKSCVIGNQILLATKIKYDDLKGFRPPTSRMFITTYTTRTFRWVK